MWLGLMSTSIQSGVFVHPVVWPQYAWAENWVVVFPFEEGKLGSYLKPWFHVKINLLSRILGMHGTTSEMK